MKIDLKGKFKLIKALLKRNAFSLACFVLAFLVSITGTLSYSRYISSAPVIEDPNIGSFNVSSNIDTVSALSFTNTAFWGGTDADSRIAMNALRSIEFSVNNFETVNGEERVADVRTAYTLVFVAPKNFIERMAFQVFDANEHPMIPQFVSEDFLREAEEGHEYDTSDSAEYHGVYGTRDLVFTTTKLGNGSYQGESQNENGKITIKFVLQKGDMHQQLLFRTWDCWELTENEPYYLDSEEGGDLLPPLTVNYTNTVDFYMVTIAMEKFILPAGEKMTREHCIHLTPTHPLHDHHLGSFFIENYDNGNGDSGIRRIHSIYGGPNADGVLENWTLKSIHEDVTSQYFVDDRYDSGEPKLTLHGIPMVEQVYLNVMGNKKVYNVGEEVTEKSSSTTTIENASPHMGGIWVHEAPLEGDDPKLTSGFEYIYMQKETDSSGNVRWRVLGPGSASSPPVTITANQGYFRIKVDPATSKRYTNVATTISTGALHEEINVTETYKVRSVEILPTGQEKIILEVHEDVDYLERVTGTATKTTGVKYEFDYLMGNIEEYVTTGWWWNQRNEWTTYTGLDFSIHNMVYTDPTETEVFENYNLDDYYNEDNYIIKTIVREEHTTEIKIESIEWSVMNEHGVFEDVTFTYDSPFNFYQNYTTPGGAVVEREKIFLSQCYSKNYPFSVNVLFTQLLN